MSTDLQWLLIRGNNSFIVKRVPEGPIFSKEPGNLRNLHSHKYSGIANSKTVIVKDTGADVQISFNKKGASTQAVKPGRSSHAIKSRSGSRRSLGVTSRLFKRGYRPDLRQAALARVSAVLASRKEHKSRPEKKPRGKKA
ncbi:hypothetical protein JAAARDRAFT_96662, partial [Jaapia argillacea MUCL 33604]